MAQQAAPAPPAPSPCQSHSRRTFQELPCRFTSSASCATSAGPNARASRAADSASCWCRCRQASGGRVTPPPTAAASSRLTVSHCSSEGGREGRQEGEHAWGGMLRSSRRQHGAAWNAASGGTAGGRTSRPPYNPASRCSSVSSSFVHGCWLQRGKGQGQGWSGLGQRRMRLLAGTAGGAATTAHASTPARQRRTSGWAPGCWPTAGGTRWWCAAGAAAAPAWPTPLGGSCGPAGPPLQGREERGTTRGDGVRRGVGTRSDSLIRMTSPAQPSCLPAHNQALTRRLQAEPRDALLVRLVLAHVHAAPALQPLLHLAHHRLQLELLRGRREGGTRDEGGAQSRRR